MKEELLNLIEDIQGRRDVFGYNEASIKQGIILPILKALGWDPFNTEEVYPEYSVGDNRVDYALRHNNKNMVFIEVKKASEDIGKHQEQLLKYAFQEGIKLAVLTNGISWWFYLPLREGIWEQRKFYTIEIYDQNINEIVKNFFTFLSKESVISGKAIESAENIYKSKHREELIRENLPKAWHRIITEPDDILVELIAETTERMCGHRPENEVVEQFLKSISRQILTFSVERRRSIQKTPRVQESLHISQDYTGKQVISFIFKGKKYNVKTWKEMLLKILEIVYYEKSERFSEVFTIQGHRRRYFSNNPDDLKSPKPIADTGIYVESNFNANYIVKLIKEILKRFGYRDSDLTVEYR